MALKGVPGVEEVAQSHLEKALASLSAEKAELALALASAFNQSMDFSQVITAVKATPSPILYYLPLTP